MQTSRSRQSRLVSFPAARRNESKKALACFLPATFGRPGRHRTPNHARSMQKPRYSAESATSISFPALACRSGGPRSTLRARSSRRTLSIFSGASTGSKHSWTSMIWFRASVDCGAQPTTGQFADLPQDGMPTPTIPIHLLQVHRPKARLLMRPHQLGRVFRKEASTILFFLFLPNSRITSVTGGRARARTLLRAPRSAGPRHWLTQRARRRGSPRLTQRPNALRHAPPHERGNLPAKAMQEGGLDVGGCGRTRTCDPLIVDSEPNEKCTETARTSEPPRVTVALSEALSVCTRFAHEVL